MLFILEIVAGQYAGARYSLAPGQRLVIGRSTQASLPMPEDSFLSSTHLSLEVTEDGVFLRDLKSTNGTFVNGQRIAEASVRPGDVITAGSLELRIVRQSSAQPTVALAAKEPAGSELPILNHLRTAGVPVYCLLDAACDQSILPILSMASEPIQSLYNGQSAIDLAPWAPYLAELPLNSKLAAAILSGGWGKGWASYFVSRHPFEELRQHFRKFLLIKMDNGSEAYFRFYDPRVLREFLPTSTRSEIWEFFGPVEKWIVESANPETLLEMTHEYGNLKMTEVSIASLT